MLEPYGDYHHSKPLSISEKVSRQRDTPTTSHSETTDQEWSAKTSCKLRSDADYSPGAESRDYETEAEQEPQWMHHLQGETAEVRRNETNM
jgi:hypothetical protein